MNRIIPTAEPFFFPGNRTGCLLIHGFTGTPKEMRGMGEFLSAQGFSVLGIRLAGHATQPADMIRSRWADWAASVEDGYRYLSQITDKIYFVGLSMGGSLSLLMSTRLPSAGIVAMSTPYQMPTIYPPWLLRMIAHLIPYRPKTSEPPGSGWFDPSAYAGHISYPQNPIRSAVELQSLLASMRGALPQVRTSVLLIHSKDDRYVLPENMEDLYARLVNAADRKMLWIKGSGHVVTRDAAKGEVFEAALKFIKQLESKIE